MTQLAVIDCPRCGHSYDEGQHSYCPSCNSCGFCGCCPCNEPTCYWCGEQVAYKAARKALLNWATSMRTGSRRLSAAPVQRAMVALRAAYVAELSEDTPHA